MFKMYAASYTGGGQELWFKTPEELFKRYPCFITFNQDNNHLTVYAMFQIKNSVNKISLVCHNSTDNGKQDSINLRLYLVKQPGWILEAADKVSWLLRKNNAPIIQDDMIADLLEIDKNNENDKIIINKNFDKGDKTSYQYTRCFHDINTGKVYESKETLFGTAKCNYINKDCDRICNNEH